MRYGSIYRDIKSYFTVFFICWHFECHIIIKSIYIWNLSLFGLIILIELYLIFWNILNVNCSYKDLETNSLRLPPVDLSAFASGLPSRCDLSAYLFLVCIWFENLSRFIELLDGHFPVNFNLLHLIFRFLVSASSHRWVCVPERCSDVKVKFSFSRY